MRIEHDKDSYIEVEDVSPSVFHPEGTLVIEVADYSGTLDEPWRTASITLTAEEEEQLYNYLRQRVLDRGYDVSWKWRCKNDHEFSTKEPTSCPNCSEKLELVKE